MSLESAIAVNCVEPYLSPQWFVKIKPLAEPAIKAVEDGRIRIVLKAGRITLGLDCGTLKTGASHDKSGGVIQIPAWYCRTCNGTCADINQTGWYLDHSPGGSASRREDSTPALPGVWGQGFIRDPDVLTPGSHLPSGPSPRWDGLNILPS